MKKFFGCAALVCAMLLVFGCEDPSTADTSSTNTSSTSGTSSSSSSSSLSSYTFHYDVDIPTVTLPTLPASSGNDVFAGTTVVNHEFRSFVFGTDGTIICSHGLKYTSGSIVPRDATEIYEYSYDSTHLYMRFKKVIWEDGETWVTPQEYLNYLAIDLDTSYANNTEYQEGYQEYKAECDAESGGSTYEEYAAYVINYNLEMYETSLEQLTTYTVSNGVIQYQYPDYSTDSQQQLTGYYIPFLSSDADTLKGYTYVCSNAGYKLVFGNDGTITEYRGVYDSEASQYVAKVYATYAYKLNSNYIYMACLTHADINTETGAEITDGEGNYTLVSYSTYCDHYGAKNNLDAYEIASIKTQVSAYSYEGTTITYNYNDYTLSE